MDQPSKITLTQSATSLREQLIGTWDLVSNYAVRQDGSRLDPFGPNPTGRYMLDAAGHFSYMIYGSGRPKFASNNRREGTQEENKAAVQGIITFYGTYIVDESSAHRHLAGRAVQLPELGGIRKKNQCNGEWG